MMGHTGKLMVLAAVAAVSALSFGADGVSVPQPDTQVVMKGDQSAYPILLQMVTSTDETTRIQGLEGLSYFGQPDGIRFVLAATQDPSEAVRNRAAALLETLPQGILAQELTRLIVSDSEEAFVLADRVLPLLRNQLEPHFLDVLGVRDAAPEELVAALYALGRLRSTSAIPLMANLANSTQEQVARVAIEALVGMRHGEAIPYLEKLYSHPKRGVRFQALEGVASTGSIAGLTSLRRAASGEFSSRVTFCRRAVFLMGARYGAYAIPSLITAMKANDTVQQAAGTVLADLTGEKLGASPERWEQWYANATTPPPSLGPDMMLVNGIPTEIQYMGKDGHPSE